MHRKGSNSVTGDGFVPAPAVGFATSAKAWNLDRPENLSSRQAVDKLSRTGATGFRRASRCRDSPADASLCLRSSCGPAADRYAGPNFQQPVIALRQNRFRHGIAEETGLHVSLLSRQMTCASTPRRGRRLDPCPRIRSALLRPVRLCPVLPGKACRYGFRLELRRSVLPCLRSPRQPAGQAHSPVAFAEDRFRLESGISSNDGRRILSNAGLAALDMRSASPYHLHCAPHDPLDPLGVWPC